MAVPRSPTQTDKPSRPYPLKWMENTFDSKEKTEYLLRHEVENGNVTYHDMDLAQSFFPGKKRHLPVIYSTLAFLGTVAYSRGYARPRWKLSKLVTLSTFLGFGSYTFGLSQNVSAHFKFARSLENPVGFNQALRNINTRLGGLEYFPYGVPERPEERMGLVLGPGFDPAPLPRNRGLTDETPELGESSVPSSEQDLDQRQAQQPSRSTAQQTPSKWDQIRAANNKAGAPSSWDLIRESHERNKTPLPQSSHNPVEGGTGRDETYDRGNSSDSDSSVMIEENEKKWGARAGDDR